MVVKPIAHDVTMPRSIFFHGVHGVPVYITSIFFVLNTIIVMVGTYSVSAGLHKLTALKLSEGRFILLTIDDLYWAAVVVCGVVNIVITAMNVYLTLYYLHINMVPRVIFYIIEIVCLFVLSKDFKTTDSVCCFSHRHVLRVVHTLAWCQLVWFLHHVGYNLFVTIFFIAIAPAQTLAAITLLYSVLVCTILYIAYNINSFRNIINIEGINVNASTCKLFLAFVLYLLTVAFISLLTLIFNDLAENGLTSSGLGSIILSLVAPTIVFIITLKLKRQLGRFFKPPEEVSTDPSTNLESPPHDTNENTRLLVQ